MQSAELRQRFDCDVAAVGPTAKMGEHSRVDWETDLSLLPSFFASVSRSGCYCGAALIVAYTSCSKSAPSAVVRLHWIIIWLTGVRSASRSVTVLPSADTSTDFTS